jgi:hypothetical protein
MALFTSACFVYAVTGEHPRLGAMDVCPFIPVRGVTMAECVSCAMELGHLLASELDIPVFLYGAAASRDYRKTVSQIRAGEYEALANRVSWCTVRLGPMFNPCLRHCVMLPAGTFEMINDFIRRSRRRNGRQISVLLSLCLSGAPLWWVRGSFS